MLHRCSSVTSNVPKDAIRRSRDAQRSKWSSSAGYCDCRPMTAVMPAERGFGMIAALAVTCRTRFRGPTVGSGKARALARSLEDDPAPLRAGGGDRFVARGGWRARCDHGGSSFRVTDPRVVHSSRDRTCGSPTSADDRERSVVRASARRNDRAHAGRTRGLDRRAALQPCAGRVRDRLDPDRAGGVGPAPRPLRGRAEGARCGRLGLRVSLASLLVGARASRWRAPSRADRTAACASVSGNGTSDRLRLNGETRCELLFALRS